jgi:hypothetical protein
MTEKPIENENQAESVTSDLPEEVVAAMLKGRQLTIERARKLAQAVSTAATTAVQHLPGRQLTHRLPAPPFAGGLPKLPKLPEADAVRAAARDYASQLLAEQRRFAHEVVAEPRRYAGELVSAVSASRPAGEADEAGGAGEAAPSAE